MRWMNTNLGCRLCVIAFVAAGTAGPAVGEVGYEITDLTTLAGVIGGSVNDLGQVVGAYEAPGGQRHAYLWDQEGGLVDLGTLGGNVSYGIAINNLGQVVGHSQTASGDFRAFLWTAESGMTDLGAPAGSQTAALDINNVGQVLVRAAYPLEDGHMPIEAFVWTAQTGLQEMTPVAGVRTMPYAINDSGLVAASRVADWSSPIRVYAYTWESVAGWTLLDQLDREGYPQDLNEQGQVVGSYFDSEGMWPVLWETGSAPLDLAPAGATVSKAHSINDLSQVVGYYDGSGFLWTEQTGPVELDSLLDPSDQEHWHIAGGNAINNRGQIMADALFDDDWRFVLLTPVPEPATLALLCLGGIAVLGRRRR